MDIFAVNGGKRLFGELEIAGAKNAALPLLAAALLTDDEIVIKNCPDISDVRYMCGILREIGCSVCSENGNVCVCAKSANVNEMPECLAGKIRSSIFMMGSMVARFGCAECVLPGGCDIGKRPIDLHLYALKKMGVKFTEYGEKIRCECAKLKGADIVLSYPSVGATENAMMAAARADGETVIYGAAREPEIEDLQNILNLMGAKVSGAGGGTIRIHGAERLCGAEYSCTADRIAAGTYMCAVCSAGGDVLLTGIHERGIRRIADVLEQAGAYVKIFDNSVRVRADDRLKAFTYVETAPFPGFPTDMQAQICAVACTAKGISRVRETVFENRMRHIPELRKTGANIVLDGCTAYIEGMDKLNPADMRATDLRGGAAMIIAALKADGISKIRNISVIDRGYDRIEEKLALLGADITRESYDG